MAYCSCKAGARTLGGCAHSCAILYYLNINEQSKKEQSNTAQKRITVTKLIDLKPYKKQKNNSTDNQSQMYNIVLFTLIHI